MKRFREYWFRFWFPGTSPVDLAVSRILFFLLMICFFWGDEIDRHGMVPMELRHPLPVFETLHLELLAPAMLSRLHGLWLAVMACAAAGLFTRVATALSFGIGFYLLCLPQGYGVSSHEEVALILVLFLMAFSPCGDALSLDGRWRKLRRKKSDKPTPGGEYGWPLQLARVVAVFAYFSAGVMKLRNGGLGWAVDGESFLNNMIWARYAFGPYWAGTSLWGLGPALVARAPWMTTIIPAMAVVVELLSPALLVPRWCWWMMGTLLAMHVGIFALMGIPFHYHLALVPFFVPWKRLRERLTWLR